MEQHDINTKILPWEAGMKLHQLLFLIFLFLIPFQTRILYFAEKAYVGWYFDYHQAFFLYLTDIALAACFTLWLVFDKPKVPVLENRLFLLILGFFFLILVTLFHVKRLDLGVYQTLKWLEFFGIVLYIHLNYRESRLFHLSAMILFISGVFQAILGWFQFHVQHMAGFTWLGEYIAPSGTPGLATIQTAAGKIIRAYGTMPHPNILGGFLVLCLVCGLYLLSTYSKASVDNKRQSKSIRALVVIGLVIICIGLFTTFSRMAWIAAGIAGLCFVFYYWKTNRKLVLVVLLPILVSCATIGVLYRDDLQARVTDTNQRSIADRYFFNRLGLDLSSRYPMLGVGVGNYIEALTDIYQLEPWQHQPAHNIFIFISAELGFLGLGLFLMILFEIFSQLKNIIWDPLSFGLILIGLLFLLMGQFDHYFVTIQQGRLMFAVVLGLIAAVPNIYDYQKSN